MIKCKEIEKKTCILCGNDAINDGIIIKKKSFCKSCVLEITEMNVDDEKYDYVKEKIKATLFIK